ncbi:hypothetical protein L1887_10811 [Cichorium endivia]|nr:hypothetical protein L1887_10811 [Cichorium endivia]
MVICLCIYADRFLMFHRVAEWSEMSFTKNPKGKAEYPVRGRKSRTVGPMSIRIQCIVQGATVCKMSRSELQNEEKIHNP